MSLRALLAFNPCILLLAIRYLIPTPLPAFLILILFQRKIPHTREDASMDMENIAVRCVARHVRVQIHERACIAFASMTSISREEEKDMHIRPSFSL